MAVAKVAHGNTSDTVEPALTTVIIEPAAFAAAKHEWLAGIGGHQKLIVTAAVAIGVAIAHCWLRDGCVLKRNGPETKTAARAAEGKADDSCLISVLDRKSTRLNSSHVRISYAVFCLKKNTTTDMLC